MSETDAELLEWAKRMDDMRHEMLTTIRMLQNDHRLSRFQIVELLLSVAYTVATNAAERGPTKADLEDDWTEVHTMLGEIHGCAIEAAGRWWEAVEARR